MSARSGRESPVKAIRGLLFPLTVCVFIALRLAGVTDWSWWWVIAPLWIGIALTLLALGAFILPFALLALYVRIRLRFRLRRAFPEIFIDPTAWSRVPADNADDR
jgi:hypothetical protein